MASGKGPSKKAYVLPLVGHAVSDVVGSGRFTLKFDDPAGSELFLEGPFSIGAGDQVDEHEPPCAEWVRDVLMSFIGVRIQSARFARTSELAIVFEDGRRLLVGDGPFENWHYSSGEGLSLHGGVGRVA